MKYHTKEYYTLMMSLGTVDMYEPIVDKEYSDEEIEELFQQALDRYVEEERADYDEPPELIIDEDDDEDELDFQSMIDEYMNREPFNEEETAEEFRELYIDNLEEPDEDLPVWVRETVDPRILAMYFIPEKIYRKLAEEDEANEERFDELDELADEALEKNLEELPEEYQELVDILEELENLSILDVSMDGGELEFTFQDWDDEGDEIERSLSFMDVEVIEDEGLQVSCWEDEDGDTESDCELVYSEVYVENGIPEIHMMFDNNGLKYLTFRCGEI